MRIPYMNNHNFDYLNIAGLAHSASALSRLQESIAVQKAVLGIPNIAEMAHSALAMSSLQETIAAQKAVLGIPNIAEMAHSALAMSSLQETIVAQKIALGITDMINPMLQLQSDFQIASRINFYHSNYLGNISATHLDLLTTSINLVKNFALPNIDLTANVLPDFIEDKLEELAELTEDERNYILLNAESIIDKTKNYTESLSITIKDQIAALLAKAIPSALLKNLTPQTALQLIIVIVEIVNIYFSMQSHNDAVQAHQDAVQAHQDAIVQQKQTDEIIKYSKQTFEVNQKVFELLQKNLEKTNNMSDQQKNK
nr:MAG TPA: hypothetical protein [Caudoviricetes sp.]